MTKSVIRSAVYMFWSYKGRCVFFCTKCSQTNYFYKALLITLLESIQSDAYKYIYIYISIIDIYY